MEIYDFKNSLQMQFGDIENFCNFDISNGISKNPPGIMLYFLVSSNLQADCFYLIAS